MSGIVVATQRVIDAEVNGEIREGLDVRWSEFLHKCGLILMPVPNNPVVAMLLADRAGAVGVLLTGGGDLPRYGGKHARRQATEEALVAQAQAIGRPVLGICRGMEFLLDRTGVKLTQVQGHTGIRHELVGGSGTRRTVGSAHLLGAVEVNDEWTVEAISGGVVEAVCHVRNPWRGMMWHPEREEPFHEDDIALFRQWFGEL